MAARSGRKKTEQEPGELVNVEVLPPEERGGQLRQEEAAQRSGSRGRGGSEEGPVVEVDDEDRMAQEIANRKAAVLIEIINSGPDLEASIKRNAAEIDETLLLFLWKRVQAAEQNGEGNHVVEALTALFNRLRREAERQASSPALRLLDDALSRLTDDEAEPDASERRAATRDLLERAFRGKPAEGLDIFGMAALLAAGSDIPPDELGEFVPREVFVEEVSQLVEDARQAMRKQKAEVAAMRGTLEEVELVEAVQQRAVAIAQAEEVLRMAESM